MNIHIVLRDFYHFFLIDLLIITRLLSYETCSSLQICILFVFSLIQLTLTFQSDIARIWAHTKRSTLLFQSKWPNRLRLTPLAITVYVSHLLNPTPSHQLSSTRLPKCIKKWGMLHFSRDWEQNNKKHFQCWNREWYSYLYQYKTSVPDGYWLHTLLVKH